MKKKIAVGMFLILAMVFALGFEAIDRPSVSVSAEAYSPNETEYVNTTWIKAEIEKLKKVPEMQIAGVAIHQTQKEVVLWVYGLTPENQQIHRKMINGWEIIVAQSPIPADQMLAQVITPHTARIIIEQGRVTSAIMDEKWDMLELKLIDSNNPLILVNSTVFEGERWMRLLNDGKVICYSDHYYPDYKEITIREGHISKEEIDAFLELFSNLSECSDYTVNVSEQLIGRDHMDCVFVPFGDAKISCIPLNKTLKLRLRPPSFPEPETITITAKEIMKRIDNLYREAKITERKKEINPYHAKPFAVTIAYHEKALVVGAVAIIALMVGVMGFILKKRRR